MDEEFERRIGELDRRSRRVWDHHIGNYCNSINDFTVIDSIPSERVGYCLWNIDGTREDNFDAVRDYPFEDYEKYSVQSRKKDDIPQKVERRLRRWIIKKTLSFIYAITVLFLIIIAILYLVVGVDWKELGILLKITKKTGAVLVTSIQNKTAGG